MGIQRIPKANANSVGKNSCRCVESFFCLSGSRAGVVQYHFVLYWSTVSLYFFRAQWQHHQRKIKASFHKSSACLVLISGAVYCLLGNCVSDVLIAAVTRNLVFYRILNAGETRQCDKSTIFFTLPRCVRDTTGSSKKTHRRVYDLV